MVVALPVTARFVEVACVVVEKMPDKWVMVEEAVLTRIPLVRVTRPAELIARRLEPAAF